MEARMLRVALLVILLGVSMGARHTTPNFVIITSDAGFARQMGEAAEKYRRDLAVSWLGEAMPNWSKPCPITVQVGQNLGAGGATTFMFDRGEVFGWRMTIQGSRERLLDSVLPHEITHMVFASHFRSPVPRWADEGGATSVEHAAERSKHRRMLQRFLRTGRGIAFNRMFAMTQYPRDIMPLYAQGYSVAEYLIQQGGRRKFVDFVGEGMKTKCWSAALQRHYSVADLGQLQKTWLAWVGRGCPALSPQENQPGTPPQGEMLALAESTAGGWTGASVYQHGAAAGAKQPAAKAQPAPEYAPGSVVPASASTAGLPSDGWRAAGTAPTEFSRTRAKSPPPASVSNPFRAHVTRPQPFQPAGHVLREWGGR